MRPLRRGWLPCLVFLQAVLLSGAVNPDDPGTPLTPAERTQGYRNGHVLIKLRENQPGGETARQLAEQQAGVRGRSAFEHFKNLEVLDFDPAQSVPGMVKQLRATGLYEFVEPDRIVHARTVPNDPSFSQQWSLRNTGQTGGTAGADIGATAAWDTVSDASGVIVAVLDSGARLTHEDLAANLWNNPSPNTSGYVNDLHGINATVGQSQAMSGTPTDNNGHGTHVSGILGAAGNNGAGISGVAWRVQLMELKFIDSSGSGATSNEIACLNYAIAHGATIINASFGSVAYSNAEFTALQQARAAGVIVVAAAGNDGENSDLGNDYPADYLLDNVVTVAATTSTDALAFYSNYGSGAVDLAAPGDAIYSSFNRSDSDYAVLSGTSMAAPHVAGALALLKAHFPSDTYRELINRLLRSTSRLAGLSGKVQSGGRLNVAQAVASTSNRPMNDDFSARAQLVGAHVRVRSSNADATAEAGEPAHAGVSGGKSLWWTWTSPVTGQVAFDTSGSTYDTVIAVYTGGAVNALTPVAANDDTSAGDTTSSLTLNATAGTVYQIAIDGKNGATGNTVLRLGTVPANNDFANALPVSGASFTATGSTLGANRQSGEPNPAGSTPGHSVWYAWTAPATGHYNLGANSNTVDMIAGVYTGTAVSNLALVAFNDDSFTSGTTIYNSDSLVSFTATAGQTYYLGIDNYDADGGDFRITLNDSAWQFVSAYATSSSPAVGSDGTVYFGSQDFYVYAVNPDGTEKWERGTGNSIDLSSPAIGADGTVYIGSEDGYLYALNGATGAVKWKTFAATGVSSTPAIGADGTVYFRDDTTLHALTPGSTSATQKWTFLLNGTYSSPSVGADGTIYIGAVGGALYALNPDGTQKWKFTANGDIYTTPAIGGDGTIYFGTYGASSALYALNPDGSQKWAWSGGGGITSSPAIGGDGTIYFGAYDHKLHALTSGGSEKWSCLLGDEVHGSSPAVAADGTVYVGTLDGLMYAVTAGGAIQRVFSTADEIHSSPALANGRLYFTSYDAKLYAFNVGQNAAGSAWPMFHGNLLRTGLAASGSTTITTQPQSQAVATGGTLTLSVAASGAGPLTYQWYRNGGAIGGATGATYTVAAAAAGDAGTYTVVVTGAQGSVTSNATTVTVGNVVPSRLANLSVRAQAGSGAQTLIVGFIVGGGGKNLLIRGIGPGLNTIPGVNLQVVPDPLLTLYDGSTPVLSDDNWGGSTALSNAFALSGAFALPDAASKDAALLTPVDAKAYTAQITSVDGTTGVALAEIYDTDSSTTLGRLANISARAQVGTGGDVLIAGFIISGNAPKKVLIRAIGPGLNTIPGVHLDGLLANPRLDLYSTSNGTTLVQSNDNWGDNGGSATLSAAFTQTGAFPLPDTTSTDAAMVVTLPPGNYTANVSGVNNTTGVALVEVYEMP